MEVIGRNESDVMCIPIPEMNSMGFWRNEWPNKYVMPMLLLQMITVIFTHYTVHIALRPLNQPLIVAQLLSAVLLGPSCLSRLPTFAVIFDTAHTAYIIDSFTKIAITYYVFLAGVKMDPSQMWKSGKRSLVVAGSGLVIPLAIVSPTYYFLRDHLGSSFDAFQGTSFVLSLALTSSVVVQPILRELHLLSSKLGHLAMSVSMINDSLVMATVLVAKTFKWKGEEGANDLTLVSYLATLAAILIFTIVVARPAMRWVARTTPEGKSVPPGYTVLLLLLVMVSGFVSDTAMGNMLAGPLLLGMVTPEGPPLGSALVRRSETVVEGLLMPLYITSCGRKVDVSQLQMWTTSGSMLLLFFVACAAKVGTTLAACMYSRMPFPDALAIGLMMLFKGQVEVIRFTSWNDEEFLTNENITVLVLATVASTAIAAPAVKRLARLNRYSMSRQRGRALQFIKADAEMRVLTCIQGKETLPMTVSILECFHATKDSPLCIFVLHLVELLGRANPVLIHHKKQKSSAYASSLDLVINAFRKIERENAAGGVVVQAYTCIAPFNTVHEDICHFAAEKKATFIIIPYYKQKVNSIEVQDPCFQFVTPKVLNEAPCSVGILIHQGGNAYHQQATPRVGALFLGGPDDREALSCAFRLVRHPLVTLTVVRFLTMTSEEDDERERAMDDELVDEFKVQMMTNDRVVFRDILVDNGEELIEEVRSTDDVFDILVVGLRQEANSKLTEGLSGWSENPDLGLIGDIVYTTDAFGGTAAILIVKQQT